MTDTRPVSLALLGGSRRSGRLDLGPRLAHVALVGGMDLDLSQSELPPEGLTVTKASLVGGVHVVVPADARVVVKGFTLFGGKDVERLPDPSGPTVTIRAFGLVGGVRVRVAAGT